MSYASTDGDVSGEDPRLLDAFSGLHGLQTPRRAKSLGETPVCRANAVLNALAD
jgi:hypothetical protein